MEYEVLLEKIAKLSGIDQEEIDRRVEARRAKLSGLISKEGAAQIIAAELGVNFDNVQANISELMPGMKKVNVVGKVMNLFPVREFEKNGRKGKVVNFFIADESGSIRVVMWDINHIALVESGEIGKECVVEIKNAAMRESELHLSGFSEIKKRNDIVLINVKTERLAVEKIISELQAGQSVRVRGAVVQLFPPKFFKVCPECGKKIIPEADSFSCAEHGKVNPKERSLLNFVLDDGSETIRVTLFSDQINKLIFEEDLKNPEKVIVFRDDLLGTELFVTGTVRNNQLFNNLEIAVQDVEKVDVSKLILELEKQ